MREFQLYKQEGGGQSYATLIRNANFRHHLNQDLKDLLATRDSGDLICGNMAQDEYVSETLEKFARQTGQEIKHRGNFWFFQKK